MKFFKQIRKNVLFKEFTDKEIEQLFDCLSAKIEKRSSKDLILRPNEEMDSICIILEGNLVEFTIKPNGSRSVVSSKVDGDMFGLPYCFASDNKSATYITTATDAYLLYISAKSIFEMRDEDCPCKNRLIANVVRYLSDSAMELKNNNDFITIRGMRKKIAKFIYEKYLEQGTNAVILGVDRNGMAKYLNVSRPSMSREMINMREEGIFDFRKELVTITNPDALRKIVEGE